MPINKTENITLPPNWEEYFDSKSGQKYYVNHITKTTTWERPEWSTKNEIAPEAITQIPDKDVPCVVISAPLSSKIVSGKYRNNSRYCRLLVF